MARPRELSASVAATAVLATLPAALLLSLLLARMPSWDEDTRFTLGITSFVPLWVTSICVTATTRSARRAFVVCLALSLTVGVFLLLTSRGVSA